MWTYEIRFEIEWLICYIYEQSGLHVSLAVS